MVALLSLIVDSYKAAAHGVAIAISPRNRRITLAILSGGATIAGANWLAMSQPAGESFLGLGPDGTSGAVLAPAYGGLVTGLVAGFGKRPVYADGSAGTFAAFAGMAMLMTWAGIARITGSLPPGSEGFERFGPISAAMFVLIIGSANVFITFPTAFLVIFVSRSFVPNNQHRYGWISDDPDNPGLVYVTPGPASSGSDLTSHSTAYSRFSQSLPRFSQVPRRFLDVKPE